MSDPIPTLSDQNRLTMVTIKQRTELAQSILAANTHLMQKESLQYWTDFVPYAAFPMLADEGEVEHVESLYLHLRTYAFEWLTDWRLKSFVATFAQIVETQKGMNVALAKVLEGFEDLNKSLPPALTEIERRLEELENPNSGRLGDHR